MNKIIKIISLILLSSLLLLCCSGCLEASDSKDGTDPTTPVSIKGEINKDSDLVVTLVAYLEQYWVEYDIAGRSFSAKINDMKNGIQPLHVAFDPSSYYFVCGYYNSPSENGVLKYYKAKEYTWVGYESELEIQEYYNGMKWAVVFQVNKALTVSDVLPSERTVPSIEHFQIYTPTFENGVNISAPVVFNESFIYLNYPDCYLNRFSKNTSTMYYCKSIYYHSMNTIPCVYLDGEYYLPFHLYTVSAEGQRIGESDYVRTFGEYYSTLWGLIEKNKYQITDRYERTRFYGTISLETFVNDVLK